MKETQVVQRKRGFSGVDREGRPHGRGYIEASLFYLFTFFKSVVERHMCCSSQKTKWGCMSKLGNLPRGVCAGSREI